ncbi:winged helix-turn-helix domain-containing protein [Microvirga sp. Mcv34]|uniref:winged helix-turn-helix domain-containing protein n=1 Tax=Microvirga sp. Mcv34 TaxID=2926016 RepID=UPI0039675FF5
MTARSRTKAQESDFRSGALGRELRALNFRKLSARPRHHEKSETAVAAFKIYGPAVRCKRAVSGWMRDGSHQSIRPQYGA